MTATAADSAARKVMIAVDHSEGSKHAFEFTLENICRDGDVLHIVHAVRPQVQPFAMEASVMTPAVVEAVEEDHRRVTDAAKKFVRELTEICEKRGVKTSEHVLDLGGDSRDAIVDFSKDLKPALLVVGSRGHGAVKRVLLGSLSTYAMHNCECPVVVVR